MIALFISAVRACVLRDIVNKSALKQPLSSLTKRILDMSETKPFQPVIIGAFTDAAMFLFASRMISVWSQRHLVLTANQRIRHKSALAISYALLFAVRLDIRLVCSLTDLYLNCTMLFAFRLNVALVKI